MSNPGNTYNPVEQGQEITVGEGLYYFAQDFYIYQASFGNLAAGASTTVNIQVQSDSDFEWLESTAYGNLNGGATPFPDTILLPINVNIVDGGSSRALFSAPIPLSTFAGNGKQPFILPISRIFKAYASIQLTAANFAAAQYDNLSLNLIGRKLFRKNATPG